jgi:hypothetical protein
MVYVDDGFVIASTKAKADDNYEVTLFLFKMAGFTIAEEKEGISRLRDRHQGHDGRGSRVEDAQDQGSIEDVLDVELSQSKGDR